MVERAGASEGGRDGLTDIPALGIGPGAWRAFLEAGLDDAMLETIRAGERTGRPLGDAGFIAGAEFRGHYT